MRKSSYCFHHVLAITILSVPLSVTKVDQSKAVQARITKFSTNIPKPTISTDHQMV